MSDQVRLDGGEFTMGSNRFYPEEGPPFRARVDAFSIDTHLVTNAEYAAFVHATGYVTVAERPLDPSAYPGAIPELLVPGALVFQKTAGPVDLRDWTQWWNWTPGAHWRTPLGPGSTIDGLDDHPVVQVSFEDAEAYAAWAGKALATEAEWEYAARGGLEDNDFTWGNEMDPQGRARANRWYGEFPWQRNGKSEYERTSPVGAFPANGFGLYDMAGNVWEWTADWYVAAREFEAASPCCDIPSPRSVAAHETYDPRQPEIKIPRKVVKGGSHLCAPNYCLRFRPAARSPQMIDTAMSHLGFRCVRR
jgi:formylglycine-generating enzyme required for sulfatase activity